MSRQNMIVADGNYQDIGIGGTPSSRHGRFRQIQVVEGEQSRVAFEICGHVFNYDFRAAGAVIIIKDNADF